MKNLLISILINLVMLPLVFAGGEQAAGRYVEYWNAGEGRAAQNEGVFTRDFLERRGPDGLAKIMKMVYADNGEIAIQSITTNSEKQVVFVASLQKGKWMEISLDLAPDMKIAGMGINLVPAPPGDGDTGLSEAQIVAKLETFMNERAAARNFSGSVLLARQGEVLFAQAFAKR